MLNLLKVYGNLFSVHFKQLKAIAQLIEEQKSGKVLNELQVQKVESLDQVMTDLEQLTKE